MGRKKIQISRITDERNRQVGDMSFSEFTRDKLHFRRCYLGLAQLIEQAHNLKSGGQLESCNGKVKDLYV